MLACKKFAGPGRKGYLLFPLLIFLVGFLIPVASVSYSVAQEPLGWYEQDAGEVSNLYAVEAVDELTAWVVGAEGTILKTTDGGNSWIPQDSGTTLALADISAVDGSTAWVVGGDAVTGVYIVLRTINGGSSWVTIAQGTGYMLSEIEAVSAEVVWVAGAGVGIAGSEGVISKTMDGGGTWYLQPPGVPYVINDIEAVDADTAWAVGGDVVLRTTNGGWTWSPQTPELVPGMDEPLTFLAVEAIDTNNVWVLGTWLYDAGIVSWTVGFFMRSGDGGSTWYAPLAGRYGFASGLDISAVDASTAWVVGTTTSSGNISKTSNGGTTWACPQISDPVVDLADVSAASTLVAWAISEDGTIIHTVNGGFIQPAPHIDSISPLSGKAGLDPLQITITGSNFGSSQGMNSVVAFGSWPVYNTDSWSDIEITFSIDPTIFYSSPPGPYEVTVTTAGGTSNAATFTILEGLEVQDIYPSQGIQYTLFMDCNLTGAGFKPGAKVRLENETGAIGAISVNVISPVQIAFTISLFGVQPGVYDVVVTNPDGSEARLEEGFTVNPLCGSGSGTAVLMLGLTLGLLSLAGSSRLRKRKKGA